MDLAQNKLRLTNIVNFYYKKWNLKKNCFIIIEYIYKFV